MAAAMDYMNAPDLLDQHEHKTRQRSIENTFQLIDAHIPSVAAGDQTITVRQTLDATGINNDNSFEISQQFRVELPAYALQPHEVVRTFPKEGATGNFQTSLPFIVLKRSTLPWERSSFDQKKGTPWLALVLLDQSETDVTAPLKSGDKIAFDTNWIDWQQVHLLSLVLKKMDDNEHALVICPRLPRANATSVMHLVAIDEGHFQDIPTGQQEFTSIYNWSFVCNDAATDLMARARQLEVGVIQPNYSSQKASEQGRINQGFTPVPHFTRYGMPTVSWYRSPFVPVAATAALNIQNARSADELLMLDKATEMLNATYSAAWELGKFLTLQETNVATALYEYKRQLAQSNKKDWQHQQQTSELDWLFKDFEMRAPDTSKARSAAASLPTVIKDWFNKLLLLSPVPFNYLVPDEGLLPNHSLRLFKIDQLWLKALLDGAMSIGRLFESQQALQRTLIKQPLNWSGFIMRSSIVRDFTDLEVRVNGGMPLHTRQLGDDIWLVLHNQIIQNIELGIRADGVQLGVQQDAKGYFIDINDNRVDVNINNQRLELAALINSLQTATQQEAHSALLGQYLIAPVQRVEILQSA